MGFTIFIITVIEICLFVGIFADAKTRNEELRYMYKIIAARHCNIQSEIKKLQKEIEEMKGEEDD